MDIRERALSALKIFSVIFFFFWISFFAPLVRIFWNFLFLGVLGGTILAIFCLDKRGIKLFFDKKELPLLILILALSLGIIPAQDKVTAFHYFYSLILPIPIVYFVLKLSFQEKYSVLMLRFICLMAALTVFYGIIEMLTRYNFIYENIIKTFCYASFKGKRMMSTQIHPAALSTYLVAILPLNFILITRERKLFFKVLSWLSAVVIFLGVLLCLSRGGLIGFCLSFMVIVFLVFKQKRQFLMLCLFAVILFLMLISAVLASMGYHNFFRYSADGLMNHYYFGKFHRFACLPGVLSDHPFLGLGIGQFRIFFDHYLPRLAGEVVLNSKVPDCMYLTILAETGLIGFFAFIIFVYYFFKRIKTSLSQFIVKPERRMLIVCFLAGLAGIAGTFLTYDTLYWITPAYLFWAYLGILSALSEDA